MTNIALLATDDEQERDALRGLRPQASEPAVAMDALSRKGFGSVVMPVCQMAQAARVRQKRGQAGASLVGVMGPQDMQLDTIQSVMAAPVAPWDALVCGSEAERLAVKRMIEEVQQEQFGRFGIEGDAPMLRVMAQAKPSSDFDDRSAVRDRLGVDAETVVVLAETGASGLDVLSRIAPEVGGDFELWLPNGEPDAVTSLERLCEDLNIRAVVGDLSDILPGADIFVVCSDQPDEGAMLQAMDAGLPVVAPNWGGVDGLVQHESTGFLVPTYQTRPGAGEELADRLTTGADTAAQHASLLSQQTAFDTAAFADALSVLVNNAYLRKPMGQAGAEYVAEHRSGAAVWARYGALAQELIAKRPPFEPAPRRNRSYDAFDLNRGYSSNKLSAESMLTAVRVPTAEQLEALDQLSGRSELRRWIAGHAQLIWLAGQVRTHGPLAYGTFCTAVELMPGDVEGPLLFLAKYGFIHIGPRNSATGQTE